MGRREKWSFWEDEEGASWVWGRLTGEQEVFHPQRRFKPGCPGRIIIWQEGAGSYEFKDEQPLVQICSPSG